MTERKASETALGVAVLRAVHQLADQEPKILDDPVIVRMLDDTTLARIREHPEYYQIPRLKALKSHVLLRSRFAEDRLAEAAARGVRQFVILGAGMDTFAYRQPSWAEKLRMFEIDHPASQESKQQKLEKAGVAVPPNLDYLPVDFENDTLRAALEHSRFQFDEPAFFSCLGVLMYLTEETVDSILRFVASTPKVGEIVFTFANSFTQTDDFTYTSAIENSATAHGEPWLTKFQPHDLKTRLDDLGFSEILFLTPEMIAERYFYDRQDLIIPKHTGVVSAKN